ncbi:MAG: aldo/keto reductase [Kiritimatiellae bacterium]|nr:aldo/keto reductase [Kiritimatiellia bacterium]
MPQLRPRVILGTMTFGQQLDAAGAAEVVEIFFTSGGREIDTAHIYSGGRSEEILGQLLKGRDRESFAIATKAHPSVSGRLDAAALESQLTGSLRRLGLEFVDMFYLHQPDPHTPIETTLEACAALHRRGFFREFGLSNYAAWHVADIWHMCRREGWPQPVVYQGMYNALTREVERELFPCVSRFGMRFYAYNPLAGGILSGRYSWAATPPTEGRFHEYSFYVDRYWKEEYITAAALVRDACVAARVSSTEAALRWLIHHSCLQGDRGDGVIIGASRVTHVQQNLVACSGPPLPEDLLKSTEKAWGLVRAVCPKYFRP